MITALLLRTTTLLAMFAIAVETLSLLMIGIHNAWDTVTHIVVIRIHGDASKIE
jgi:hypothetical protein